MARMKSQWSGRGKKMLWVCKRVVVLLAILKFLLLLLSFAQTNWNPFQVETRTKPGELFFHLKSVKPLNTRPSAAYAGHQPGKSWPQLNTFSSWTVHPDLDLSRDYCETFFGNGFTHAFAMLDPRPQIRARRSSGKNDAIQNDSEQDAQMQKPSNASQPPPQDSLFQCLYSRVLRTSICEGTSMIMCPKKINMSQGGEPLDSVMGRKEEEELPYFMPGAFEIIVPGTERRALFTQSMLDRLIPVENVRESHTMHQLFQQIRTIPVDEVVCAQRISTPTVIVTRYEYEHLFHSAADLYNAYITSRITNLKKRPLLVFVDGHCKSPYDDGWKAMFSGVQFAKHLTGPVCFDHLIFSPLGYDSPFFKGLDDHIPCTGCSPEDIISNNPIRRQGITARVREFGEFFTAAFNMTPEIMPPRHNSTLKVLFVRTADYVAHRRYTGKPESQLSNELQVLEALRTWASYRSGTHKQVNNITVVEGFLAHMTLSEQLKEARESSIIVGAHGADLTHLLFSRPQRTAILELATPTSVRPQFEVMSQWMGIQYHKIQITSSVVNCSEVTQRIDQIFLKMLREQLGGSL